MLWILAFYDVENVAMYSKSGKRDAEIKLLIGCTENDIQIIREFHKEMHTLYIPNPMATRL